MQAEESLEYIVDYADKRINEAVISFRGLGEVVYDGYNNTYTSRLINDENELDSLEDRVLSSTNLQEMGIDEFNIVRKLNIYKKSDENGKPHVLQVMAPLRAKSELGKLGFETGQYIQQLRAYLAKVGDKFHVDAKVADIIKRSYELTLDYLRAYEDLKKGISKGERLKILRHKRQCINQEVEKLNQKLGNLHPEMYVEYNKKTKRVEVHITNPELFLEYFTKIGYMSPEDIRNEKWVFIDTEKPYWQYPNAKPNWISVSYFDKGDLVKREIYVRNDLSKIGFVEHNGTPVVSGFNNFDDLAIKIGQAIGNFDPLFLTGYNVAYDLDALFKGARVKIPFDRERNKLKTKAQRKKRFNRYGANKIITVDLYAIADRAFNYLPRKTLKHIVDHLFIDNSFEKTIDPELEPLNSYDQLPILQKQLETALEEGDDERTLEIAELMSDYVVGDEEILTKFIFDLDAQYENTGSVTPYSFDDYCYLAELFTLDFEALLWNYNGTWDYHTRRAYFEELGIFYEGIYPSTPFSSDKNKSRWNTYNSRILSKIKDFVPKDEEIDVIPEGAMKTYFSWSHDILAFLHEVSKTSYVYPEIIELYNYLTSSPNTTVNVNDEYDIRKDHNRQFFFAKFLEILFRPHCIDYILVYPGIKKPKVEKNIGRFKARYGVSVENFANTLLEGAEHKIQSLQEQDIKVTHFTNSQAQYLYLLNHEEQEIPFGVMPLLRNSD